ncbi:hypothetical protein M079_3062 [Bacteroides fragilis str. 3996 N(B) 6]|nr:hypothetical protein M079_3062 [Bacteroides fragilis str. 3996 N(B) 6]
MNKSNKETNLIKKLLADQLDKKERKKLYYSNLIEKQMRKQWKENKNTPVENEIGNKIWDKIENQCIKVHKRISSFRTYPINICCYYFIYKEKEHITQLSAYNRII